MRIGLLLFVFFLVMGCAQDGHQRKPWPASITSIEGFSAQEESQLKAVIEEMNQVAGKTLLTYNQNEDNYQVSFKKVAPFSSATKVGVAKSNNEICRIEINEKVFTDFKSSFVFNVVAHEIGHCADLDHNDTPGTVMSATTNPASSYSSNIIDDFINDILTSVEFNA